MPPAGHDAVVSDIDWAETLSPEDKFQFYLGKHYQDARERAYIGIGKLTIDGNVYTWDSEESIAGCGEDATYRQYQDRYQAETGVTITITTETV